MALVQLELTGRDIGGDDTCTETRQLDREATRAAADSTAKPVAKPTWRESTQITGTGAVRAATWADSRVPLTSPEIWIETIASTASPASRS